MSRHEYTLICDALSCTRQRGASANDEEAARMRVLEEARATGWDIDGLGHWCPDHPQLVERK